MRNGGIQIRMSDLMFALQKHWKGVLAATVLGLVFGLMLSGMTYVQSSFQTYEISGSVAITTLNAAGRYINGESSNNNDFHLAEDMVDAVRYVMTSNQVMDAVINDQKMLGVTVDQIRKNISISQYEATQILEVKLTWRNPEEGVDIWNAVITATNRALLQTLQLGRLAIVNPAITESAGAMGSSTQTALLLAALGFAAGIGYAIMELLVHPTLNNVRDVEPLFGLETLGTIPRDGGLFQRKSNILAQDESSEIVQSYAAAAYILRNRLGGKERHHCFYVTSSNTREGKSTVAANMAVQLSNMECRTLLIDFDTRNPSLGALFLPEVDYARSLNALYRGEATEEDAIIHVTGHLDLLPTVLEHKLIPLDGTIEDLIIRLKDQYEYIIIDSAPVGIVSDTLSLNQVTSTALFVLGYDNATIPEIQASLEKMDKSGVRVVGCIVNGVSQRGGNKDEYGTKERKKKNKKQGKKQAKKEEAFVKAKPMEMDAVEALTKQAELPAAPEEDDKAPKQSEEASVQPSPQAEAMSQTTPINPQPSKAEAVQSALSAENAPKSARRNPMDDLMQPEQSPKVLSDHDVMSALFELGFDGDWDDDDLSEGSKDDEAKGLDALDEDKAEVSEPKEEITPITASPASDTTQARPVALDKDDDEDDEDVVPVKLPKNVRPVVFDEDDDDDDVVPVKPSKNTRPVVFDEDDDDEDVVPVKLPKNVRPVVFDEDDEDDDDVVPVKPSKNVCPVVFDEDDEDDDDAPVKPSKKPSVIKARPVAVDKDVVPVKATAKSKQSQPKDNAAPKKLPKKGKELLVGAKADANGVDRAAVRVRMPVRASERLREHSGQKSVAVGRGIHNRRADASPVPNRRRNRYDTDERHSSRRDRHSRV